MQYLLALAQAAALYVIWSRRLEKRLPLFTLSIVVALPIVFGYKPNSQHWLSEVYYRLEPLALALRLASGAEAMYRLLPQRDRRQVVATTGMMAFPVPVTCWLIAGLPHIDFILFRRYAQIFELFAMLVACLYLWRAHGLIGWRWGTLERHLAVFCAIVANHAIVSAVSLHVPGWRYLGWYTAQSVSWTVAAILYASWAIFVGSGMRRVACKLDKGLYA